MPLRIGRKVYPDEPVAASPAPSFEANMSAFFRQQFPDASDAEIAGKVAAASANIGGRDDAQRRAFAPSGIGTAAQAITGQLRINPDAWDAFIAAQPRSKNIIDRR